MTNAKKTLTYLLLLPFVASSLALFTLPGTALAAAPVVEATNTSSNSATTAHTVSLPAGITAGDELIVLFGTQDPTTMSLPAGWTEIFNSGNIHETLLVGRRTADGNEGASITVTTGASKRSNHTSYRLSGAGATEASAEATGESTSPNPPSFTPSGGAQDYLWLAVAITDGDHNVSAYPTNYTDGIESVAEGAGGVLSARRELNATSENPGPFTTDSTPWTAATIAVPPDAPDAPSNLITTSVTGGVQLGWTAPASESLENYSIYRNTDLIVDEDGLSPIATISTTTTTYTDSTATRGVNYYYAVKTSTASATSSYSNSKTSSTNSGRVIRLGGLLRIN